MGGGRGGGNLVEMWGGVVGWGVMVGMGGGGLMVGGGGGSVGKVPVLVKKFDV